MSSEGQAAEPLACPSCARSYSLSERFCADCGMPLVYVGPHEERAATESQQRARKVKPQYIGGELVKVGWASNQAEAELIQGMLLEEGIPSVVRRTRGFDVPHFLAGGPRDVLVSQSAYEPARELLTTAEVVRSNGGDPGASLGGPGIPPARLAAWIIGAAGGATAIVYALYRLSG
jgi:hypothetical protein